MSRTDRFVAFLLINLIFVATVQGQTFSEKNIVEFTKCCPLGETISENGDNCVSSNMEFEPVFWGTYPPHSEVGLVIGLKCEFGRYRLEPHVDSNDEFKLLTNGSLYVPYQHNTILNTTEYCLESFETTPGEVSTLPLICFSPVPAESSWKEIALMFYSAGCIISVPFLLATLVVYCCTPFLRTDINSKVLSCHVACLTIAYTSLSVVLIFGSDLSSTICVLVAFCIQFSFLASFFWLNVLCFNMWRRLRKNADPVKARRSRLVRSRGSKRFLYYSLYAWGIPILFVVITLVMDISPSVPSAYLKPNFGIDTCWFREDTPALSYFYAPIALVLVANMLMFILSAFSVHKNTKTIHERPITMRQVVIEKIYQRRKKVFIECLILFLIMGFNWAFEVISWAVGGPPQMWFITDLYNTLQGLIVFYVFVYREKRPWQAFKAYLKCTKAQDLDFEQYGNPLHANGYAAPPIR